MLEIDEVVVGIGVDGGRAGVDRESLAAHDLFPDAACDHGLEQFPKQIAVAEPAVAVGKRRMIRDIVVEPQTAEPAIGQIEMDNRV